MQLRCRSFRQVNTCAKGQGQYDRNNREPNGAGRRNLELMTRQALPKKDIDGEAQLSTHDRLMRGAGQRTILRVISHGALLDDSTVSMKVGKPLEMRFHKAIAYDEGCPPVEIIAITRGASLTCGYGCPAKFVEAEQPNGMMTDRPNATARSEV